MQEILGLACGCAAAVFGIWAFLRGQRSMAQILHGGEPEGLRGAAVLSRGRGEPKKDGESGGYEEQFRALFSDGERKNGAEGGR